MHLIPQFKNEYEADHTELSDNDSTARHQGGNTTRGNSGRPQELQQIGGPPNDMRTA